MRRNWVPFGNFMQFQREELFLYFWLTKPNVSWSYEGHSLDDYEFIDYLDGGGIQLRNLTLTSEGGYVCNAFNDIGSTQKVFYIVVNGETDQLDVQKMSCQNYVFLSLNRPTSNNISFSRQFDGPSRRKCKLKMWSNWKSCTCCVLGTC